MDDPCPDVTKVCLKLSSVAVTVLHIDPVLSPVPDAGGSPSGADSSQIHPLSQMAEKFFTGIGNYGFGGKDFEDMAAKFTSACCADHLRFVSCGFINV